MRKKKARYKSGYVEKHYSLSGLPNITVGWLYYSPISDIIEIVAEYGGPKTKLKLVVIDKEGTQIGKGYNLPYTYYLVGKFD